MESTHSSSSAAIRWAGIIAIFAALLGVLADLALQYTSNTAHLLSKQSLLVLVTWRPLGCLSEKSSLHDWQGVKMKDISNSNASDRVNTMMFYESIRPQEGA